MSDQPDPAAPQPNPVPPTPSDSSFSPHGSGHGLPASVPPAPARDPRLDQIGKWIAGVVAAALIAGTGWVFGGIHERLDKAEDNIHKQDLVDTTFKSEMKSLKEQTQKQWDLLNGVNSSLSTLEGKVERAHGD